MFKRVYVFIYALFLVTGCVFSCNVLAQEPGDAKAMREMEIEKAIFMASGAQDTVLEIGLVDCILYALKNNSDILIKRIEPKLKEGDVKIAKADFEPTLTADYNLHDARKKSTSIFTTGISKTREIDFNAGISGKAITGTEYDIDFINERNKSSLTTQTLKTYYTAQPKITITQPLFRDFGIMVNTADINIARNNKL